MPRQGRTSRESTVGVDGLDDCLAKIDHVRRSKSTSDLPAALVSHYRELLRTYVIMGVGNLGGEMARLADMLATAKSPRNGLCNLHVAVLEELVQGLGTRSARHVMNRADLLALEVMGHLADGYRSDCKKAARLSGNSRCPSRRKLI